ncbi:nectin 1a-like [Odontesthes bonariensis]|uniref:nectin 1a-like n=1 Tax=Odontesthes bonariensis TaxID=219752 RepID=UPI003F58E8BA
MAAASVLRSFCLLGILSKGVASAIQTQRTVVAALGDQAVLQFQLSESKDVLQVTWQKILPDGEKNLATFSKYFRPRVNGDLREKMDFQCVELKNCSVVIRKVTEQDEGCYRCLFNTIPDGALTGRTCLRLYELHQPLLHVRASDSPEESVVSCSATGRPAPTVTLTVSLQHLNFSHYNTVSVNNTNGTVTVNTTAVLSGVRDDSAQVGCAVRVLSGPQKEAFVMIPELERTSLQGFYKTLRPDDSKFNSAWVIVPVVCCALACCVAAAALLFVQRKLKSKREPKGNKTPQKSTKDAHEIKTPLMKQDSEIRRRTPATDSPKNNHPKQPLSKPKRLFKDCAEAGRIV